MGTACQVKERPRAKLFQGGRSSSNGPRPGYESTSDHPESALSSMPACRNACATAAAILGAPGVSPWMQMVCAFATISDPPQQSPSRALRCAMPAARLPQDRISARPQISASAKCHPPRTAGLQMPPRRPEASFSKDIQHRRSGKAYENDVPAPASDSIGNGLGERAICRRLIVECPMRLDVRHAGAATGGNLASARTCSNTESEITSGGKFNSSRPKFARSGYPGCAPTASFQRSACSIVAFMVPRRRHVRRRRH